MKSIAKTCAVYTRKSTDERLDMEFNTLDAQREASEAYICSQRSEGWALLPQHYDDGGFSGGSLNRPALERLIEDIKAGKVDIVVVYKIDRLTRSLSDFAKLVDVFDAHGVTFVSVTQSFNTTTSMGRLTLNVLLSLAQFEREVTGERIRDKIAASKAKGMWQGGRAPFGFDIENRRLITNEEDSKSARLIFDLYLKLDHVRALEEALRMRGIKSRLRQTQDGRSYGGRYFSRGALYSLLQNPAYIGKVTHKGKVHEGLHDGIIPLEVWEAVQAKLKAQAGCEKGADRGKNRNLLTRRIFDAEGRPYSPSFTNKADGRRYRYYVNKWLALDKAHPDYARARFPSHEIENVVDRAVRAELPKFLIEQEGAAYVYLKAAQKVIPTYELIRAVLQKVIVHYDRLELTLNPQPLEKLAAEYLKIDIECAEGVKVITVPYISERTNDGAVVISPKATTRKTDPFDLPPSKLKKFVQGLIWRDEHFDGASIKSISRREGCSQDYIGSAIFYSFDTLIAAL